MESPIPYLGAAPAGAAAEFNSKSRPRERSRSSGTDRGIAGIIRTSGFARRKPRSNDSATAKAAVASGLGFASVTGGGARGDDRPLGAGGSFTGNATVFVADGVGAIGAIGAGGVSVPEVSSVGAGVGAIGARGVSVFVVVSVGVGVGAIGVRGVAVAAGASVGAGVVSVPAVASVGAGVERALFPCLLAREEWPWLDGLLWELAMV